MKPLYSRIEVERAAEFVDGLGFRETHVVGAETAFDANLVAGPFWAIYGRRTDDDLVEHIRDFESVDEAAWFTDSLSQGARVPVHYGEGTELIRRMVSSGLNYCELSAFLAACSLRDAAVAAAQGCGGDLSAPFTDGYLGFVRLCRDIAEKFEQWAVEHVDWERIDEVWPYFLEENFGDAVLSVVGGYSNIEFATPEEIAKKLKLPLKHE